MAPTAQASPPSRLALTRIVLTNFRSYESQRLTVDQRPVVLTGENGAGKTNLLEAISYLSPGRGLRGAKLAEVAHLRKTEAAADWAVAGDLLTRSGTVTIGSGWSQPREAGSAERRVVKIDGSPASGPAALSEHVGMVWLTPAMDRLFSGPPAERRRFLDRLVYAIDADHAARVQRYDRTRRDRTRLLRDGTVDEAWLSALERNMAEQAVAIAAARIDLVLRLDRFLPTSSEPFPRVAIAPHGLVEAWLADEPALVVEDRFKEHLAASRRAEAEGAPGDGPQRSDLAVTHAERNIPAALCSTGEQKAMLIALIISHARLLSHLRGAAPILLLDEITAHLDETRRRTLFEIIVDVGAQAWLTGTERTTFAPLGASAQFLAVRPGAVSEEEAIG
jgi:DNA replication and repair protein RecF